MSGIRENDTDRLVREAAAGDARAADALLDRHRDRLRRMIAVRIDGRIAPRVDASDVVQETLLAAHQRLDGYLLDPAVPFHVWLRRLATERLIDFHRFHVRAARRSVAREFHWTPAALSDQSALSLVRQLPCPRSSPSEQMVRAELLRRVRRAMGRLKETEREILVMRHLEELPVQEVAEILGLAPGTVKSRHFRALEKLQKLLDADSDEDRNES